MPQLIANLLSGCLIERSVYLVALAVVDLRGMMGDLLIAFARIRHPQLMKAFEVMYVGDIPGGADQALQTSR
jgi:hypothetical protein